jgi:hypothetical protein
VPRLGALLAVLTIGAIYLTVSERYALGPPWAVLGLIVLPLGLLAVAHLRGHQRLTHVTARLLLGVVTLLVVSSAVFLVTRLPGGGTAAPALLRDAALIWVANILLFAVWYWEIDGGGPARRRLEHHSSTDFLFPQMATPTESPETGPWAPLFVDYLFLAFNTSTAFSPTDTLVLSRRAKVLMMAQALISLVVIAVLAARAINTL